LADLRQSLVDAASRIALLTVAFRSIVIPVKAIPMNLLSVGATYGLKVLTRVAEKVSWIGPSRRGTMRGRGEAPPAPPVNCSADRCNWKRELSVASKGEPWSRRDVVERGEGRQPFPSRVPLAPVGGQYLAAAEIAGDRSAMMTTPAILASEMPRR